MIHRGVFTRIIRRLVKKCTNIKKVRVVRKYQQSREHSFEHTHAAWCHEEDSSGVHISDSDVSRVGDINNMFGDSMMHTSTEGFNPDISRWDVSSVTNMNSMFKNAQHFKGDLSSWDVSSVTDMS